MGTLGSCLGPHEHSGPMLILLMLCTVSMGFFLCLNTDFVSSTNTINVCLIVFTVNGCVDRGSRGYIAVKTALNICMLTFIFAILYLERDIYFFF